MKKLLIAFASVAIGIAANAASINWYATRGYLFDGTGESSSKLTSGTAYLVLSTYAQGDLVSLFASNKGDASTTLTSLQNNAAYLGSGAIGDDARISEGTGNTAATDSITTYFVVFNGSNMYISDTATSDYDGIAQAHDITFSTSMNKSSQALPSTGAYSGAGWYAVPEPTSGLLLLLGMAGLALKRKRA